MDNIDIFENAKIANRILNQVNDLRELIADRRNERSKARDNLLSGSEAGMEAIKLRKLIEEFILLAPEFEKEADLAEKIGKSFAKLEFFLIKMRLTIDLP